MSQVNSEACVLKVQNCDSMIGLEGGSVFFLKRKWQDVRVGDGCLYPTSLLLPGDCIELFPIWGAIYRGAGSGDEIQPLLSSRRAHSLPPSPLRSKKTSKTNQFPIPFTFLLRTNP